MGYVGTIHERNENDQLWYLFSDFSELRPLRDNQVATDTTLTEVSNNYTCNGDSFNVRYRVIFTNIDESGSFIAWIRRVRSVSWPNDFFCEVSEVVVSRYVLYMLSRSTNGKSWANVPSAISPRSRAKFVSPRQNHWRLRVNPPNRTKARISTEHCQLTIEICRLLLYAIFPQNSVLVSESQKFNPI